MKITLDIDSDVSFKRLESILREIRGRDTSYHKKGAVKRQLYKKERLQRIRRYKSSSRKKS